MPTMFGKDILLYGAVTVDGIEYFEITQELFVEIGQIVVWYNTVPTVPVTNLDTEQRFYRTEVPLQRTQCVPGFFTTLLRHDSFYILNEFGCRYAIDMPKFVDDDSQPSYLIYFCHNSDLLRQI